jgi:hypothetical protein
MGDTLTAGFADDLVTRTDEMASGHDFELNWPARVREQVARVERHGGKGRDGTVEHDPVVGPAHWIQADGARRDFAGMAVLDPQQHLFVRPRSG